MNILGKLGRERHFISLIKVMYKKIKANKILNDVTPNYFLLRSLNTFSLKEQGKDYPPSPLLLSIIQRSALKSTLSQEEKNYINALFLNSSFLNMILVKINPYVFIIIN